MRPQNNKVSVRQRDLDSNLSVNPIEDGNTPVDNLNQGVIYTSEIDDGYTNAYEGHTLSITSEKTRTGNDNFFKISIFYEVNAELPNGWFGNNLLNEGDPFSIINGSSSIDFNYIKGYIVQILNKSVATVGSVATYTYDLLCSITEGDVSSLLPSGGQIFKTNRRIFSKETRYIPPVNLYSTTKEGTNQTLFFWEDTTNSAVNYQVRVRSSDLVSYDDTYTASGNHADFQGLIEPLMFPPPYGLAGEVTTFKFVDTGIGCSTRTNPLNFITSGTPPIAEAYVNKCGSLITSNWQICEVLGTGTNFVSLNMKQKGVESTPQPTPGHFIDLPIENYKTKNAYLTLTNLAGYYLSAQIYFENFSFLSIVDAETQLLGKDAIIHNGINVSDFGSGLTKPPKIYYDKYPVNTKFAWPSILASGTYYWSVAACYDCDQKTYSEWSPEELLIIK